MQHDDDAWLLDMHQAAMKAQSPKRITKRTLSDGSLVIEAPVREVEQLDWLVDLPTRSDLEALTKNLEHLTKALERFDDRLSELEKDGPGN